LKNPGTRRVLTRIQQEIDMKHIILPLLLLSLFTLSSCALVVYDYDDDDSRKKDDDDSVTIIFHQSTSPVGIER
jgi:hypothetical protein